jgi:hypothetical protein
MAVESSDLSSASAVQSDTLNISAHVPVLLECTENRSPGSHDSHDAEQLTKMVSAIVPAPTGDKEITQGNFSNDVHRCTHTVQFLFKMRRMLFVAFILVVISNNGCISFASLWTFCFQGWELIVQSNKEMRF